MTIRAAATMRALRVLARDPAEAVDRLRTKVEHRADRRLSAPAAGSYDATEDFDAKLHQRLGAPVPCPAAAEFEDEWRALEDAFAESSSFVGDWDHDADPGMARIVWCAARHLRPERVIETGVARGITSRMILRALERNGSGRLWSIDLPFLRTSWYDETAAAVPDSLRSRWTYVRGSSRRRLPGLLAELGPLDLFVHDSAHTEANMRFEFQTAWSALRPGGVLVSHDVEMTSAFAEFATTVSDEPLLARENPSSGLVGVLVKGAGPG
jgi:predicted O-methyltransferase YrrM